MPVIDYYFTLVSPFAYLGHRALLDVADKHSAEIRYRPVMLMGVWEHSGAVPLPQRPKSRQAYRLVELQRWREKRGVELNLNPKHFPTNPGLADCSVIVLTEAAADPGDFMTSVYRACWTEDRNIADTAVLSELLEAAGHEAKTVLNRAEEDAIKAIYKSNTDAAVRDCVVGSPGYVLNGEPFWGQDRIELLDEALAAGRKAYAAE